MRQMATALGGLTIGLVLLTGCSAADEDPAVPASSPTTESPTATPAPTPTATTGVMMDLSDPELGIVFESVPDLTGDAADVYNWLATFEKESWRTVTTGQVSPAMDVIASAEVKAQGQTTVDANTKGGNVFGGTMQVRVGAISIDGDAASGTACRDYSQVTFTDAVKSYTPDEAGFGQPSLMELTFARVSAENRWRVQTLTRNGSC